MVSICEWEISYVGCPDTSVLGENKDFYENIAKTYLWNWTERQFGVCDEMVRPCRMDCGEGSTFMGQPSPFQPMLIDGKWFNIGCSKCGDQCGCNTLYGIKLPGPVDSVTEILIDGQPVTDYRLDMSTVYRSQSWPKCQDLMKKDTEENTFSITYKKGIPVPEGGQLATGILAIEFAKAACKDTTCQLPKRLQSITRQDVSIAVLDTFDDIDAGHTGIWMVDSWVNSVTKPKQRGSASNVVSPDTRRKFAR